MRLDNVWVPLILGAQAKADWGEHLLRVGFPEWAVAPKKCLLKAQQSRPQGSPETRGAGGSPV